MRPMNLDLRNEPDHRLAGKPPRVFRPNSRTLAAHTSEDSKS